MTASYLILGEGTVSCGEWIERRARPEGDTLRFISEVWVRGFLTGMNSSLAFIDHKLSWTGKDTDPAGNNLWLDNYCRLHPLTHLGDAAGALWNELSR